MPHWDKRRDQRDRRGRSLEFMIRLESRFRLSKGTEKIQSLHCDITSCFSSTFLHGQQTNTVGEKLLKTWTSSDGHTQLS